MTQGAARIGPPAPPRDRRPCRREPRRNAREVPRPRRRIPHRRRALVRRPGLALPRDRRRHERDRARSSNGSPRERVTNSAFARAFSSSRPCWSRRRRSRPCPTSSRAESSSTTQSTPTSRACRLRQRPARASSRTSTSCRARCPCGASSRSGSAAWGSSSSPSPCCPRLRVGGRQMMESELPGPEIAALGERIRETARLLWGLYVGLTVVLTLLLASLGWFGHRRGDDAVRGARARLRDDADRRLLDAAGLDRSILTRGSVDHRALHARWRA